MHPALRRRAAALGVEDEPIPEWKSADEGKLESALMVPKQAFGGNDMYATIEAKAAALLYSLAKAHALPNGNKRLALISLFFFLALNGYWWAADSEEVRVHVTWVAASAPAGRDEVLRYLTKYFQQARLQPLMEYFSARGMTVGEGPAPESAYT